MDYFLNFPNNKLNNNPTNRILSNSNAVDFHKSLDNYSKTNLFKLNNLSKKIGLESLYVKDESTRFNLNAFKGLGASYAIHQIITKNTNCSVFCTATDGNHGRALAWSAALNNKKSVVYVPKDTTIERIKAISKYGGEVIQLDLNYEETCEYAAKKSDLNNWTLVQDTSWENYEEIPALIMAGYLTHLKEMEDCIHGPQNPNIDIVFLQCGVGSWPAACIWYYLNRYKEKKPKIVLVEPNESSGVLSSFKLNKRVSPNGNFETIMAGLNCGIPSKSAWDIILNGCDASIVISDEYSKAAMNTFYKPLGNDPKIISGESGAAGLGGLMRCIEDPNFKELNKHLSLNSESRVLIFNTEGDTDKNSFKSIIEN